MREFKGYHKGINLGGWLSQCGKDNYNKEHYDTFIKEEDFGIIKSWGLDHVRVPVDAEVIQEENGALKEDGLAYLDTCMEWCKKYGLNMILDLHKAHGYIFDDENNCQLFYQQSLQDIFVGLWRELAARYGKNRDFVTFELLNEVTSADFTETWNKMAARAIKAIREVDKEVRIIVGGIFNDSIFGLKLLDPPADENIVFTFHCYSPLVFTHQGAHWVSRMPKDPALWKFRYPDIVDKYRTRSKELFGNDFDGEFPSDLTGNMDGRYFDGLMQPAVKIAEKYNVPMYCGEYGVIDEADPADALAWYKDMNSALEKNGIPRAAWSYREMNFGLEGKWLDGVRDELLKYL
ncbi:MAG: cellulase family glycosylhydrolase [Lachnospiraceae bacterium]|nr:cellulase family glycosylhydrolase [Lachnospiraceae bacterium]